MTKISNFFKSNQNIFIHGCAATPFLLVDELLKAAPALKNTSLVHLHTLGATKWLESDYVKNFSIRNFFVGHSLRPHLDYDQLDHIPCFLSEVPKFFRSKVQPLDVALLQVSKPNDKGEVSLGVTCEVAKAAFDSATVAIGEINSSMPFIGGDGVISLKEFDATIEVQRDLPELPRRKPSAEEIKIGEHIADLIENGSTLQVGIGGLPEATLSALKNHKNLGLHSEMWSDAALELIEAGVINNSQKKLFAGKSVSSFLMGTKRLYDFLHQNENVLQLEVDKTNDLKNIAANPKAVSINSAIEIDLTGQVCSDSVGTRMISGFGGQLDFVRGTAQSEGGKPIIAITSRTAKGNPRIVPTLKVGAGVVTTRADVQYVVTEFGAAQLKGKSLSERAKALISIAHPEDRERLQSEWRKLWKKI